MNRRKPFSSKKKKEQLKAKREKKRNKQDETSSESQQEESEVENVQEKGHQLNINALAAKNMATKLINYQPVDQAKRFDPNRFNLEFLKELPEELNKHRKNASKELNYKSEIDLEVDIDEIYPKDSPLDMPIRPSWSYDDTKEDIDKRERNYFAAYLNRIFENYKENELSYFEMNLETWRQLWRVLEISDILLLIVDIRYPALHFSPTLYNYCTNTLKKDVILVLNKIDLVETSLVIAWKHYFQSRFPNLHILLFSSSKQIKYKKRQPNTKTTEGEKHVNLTMSASSRKKKAENENELTIKSLAADIYTARAHRQLYECVKNIVKDKVDLKDWSNITENLIKNATNFGESTEKLMSNLDISNDDAKTMENLLTNIIVRKKYDDGFVTIGCVGFPNVGKSSLLNSLSGKKVVSVSKTPGHTKHLQTIFLTKTVRLCDCPGLVFPSLVTKPLQVLAGIYPISQLQEPFRAIRYMAERISLVDILKLKHPSETDQKEKVIEWSPLDICEAWAIKRGYFTAKASRPDVHRASNELLRMALDGKLCLALKPKHYNKEISYWNEHHDTNQLNEIVKTVEKIASENKILNDERRTNIPKKEISSNDDDDDYNDLQLYHDEKNDIKYLRDELDTDE